MLKIRPAQMKIFEEAARRRFEDEMVVHSREFAPKLCETLGEDQLRVALRQVMERAGGYGFTFRGPIRLYVELMFLFGSDFDTDPQYPALARILQAPAGQMVRAEELHAEVLDYQEKVSGSEGENTRQALASLLVMTKKPLPFSASDFVPGMLREMHSTFPEKAAYIGDENLMVLIREGIAEAKKHRFPLRGEALMVTLIYAFGHGCIRDPLYPWIARTLLDERIAEPAARSERLERKAVTWLEHVLASTQVETQT
jgi:hypothetical protein